MRKMFSENQIKNLIGVPTPSADDSGKFVGVNASGEYELVAGGSVSQHTYLLSIADTTKGIAFAVIYTSPNDIESPTGAKIREDLVARQINQASYASKITTIGCYFDTANKCIYQLCGIFAGSSGNILKFTCVKLDMSGETWEVTLPATGHYNDISFSCSDVKKLA